MESQNPIVPQNRVRTMAASQSATISLVMVASLFKSIRTKPAIAALASGHKRVNDRLPLRQLVSVPMRCGLAFGQHSSNETEMTVFKLRRFAHSCDVSTIHFDASFIVRGLFPNASSPVSLWGCRA